MIRAEDTLMGVPVEVAADMIVLANAMVPSESTKELARMFEAKTDKYGFIDYIPGHPTQSGDRVFLPEAADFRLRAWERSIREQQLHRSNSPVQSGLGGE